MLTFFAVVHSNHHDFCPPHQTDDDIIMGILKFPTIYFTVKANFFPLLRSKSSHEHTYIVYKTGLKPHDSVLVTKAQ